MRLFSNKNRPVHLGPLPLERLPRLAEPDAVPAGAASALATPAEESPAGRRSMLPAFRPYVELFDETAEGPVAPEVAPLPDDPGRLSENVKAGLYFLDADAVGIAVMPEEAWTADDATRFRYGVVIMIAFDDRLRSDTPGAEWLAGTQQQRADLRAQELAVITAGFIRNLGLAAEAHTPSQTGVDLGRTALQAGLVEQRRGALRNPFVAGGFALSVVCTDLELAPDHPLAPRSGLDRLRSTGPGWFFGRDGTRPGWRVLGGQRRRLEQGRYPMEKIKRVDETTTYISDEVPRVPQRANFFIRAGHGDLGAKFAREVKVFAFKTPQAQAYVQMIRGMVPFQDGPVAPSVAPNTSDPQANAEALKAMAHYLGGDLVGICEVPDYAWYSHDKTGAVTEPYHRNAVVILLDQGYETMEGASGDDWVSGAQSMRAYMRGAEIAGLMAEHLRALGYSARSQTNADSDVLHIPLVLQAGLGELSRIGELVLNPFVGPRFKSVVLTTDMPLMADRPIDFGLQDFCTKCTKCARECPCGAISFGDKVMFNGYEMWKPDSEKCTKYRLGNQKGAACGRCMKTCPFNIEGVLAERLFLWAAIKLPFTRAWIAKLDDRVGNGSINPIKKWWFDHEWIVDRTVAPAKGTNARDLDMARGRIADRQKIAVYPAETNPAGDRTEPLPVDRAAATEAGQVAVEIGVRRS